MEDKTAQDNSSSSVISPSIDTSEGIFTRNLTNRRFSAVFICGDAFTSILLMSLGDLGKESLDAIVTPTTAQYFVQAIHSIYVYENKWKILKKAKLVLFTQNTLYINC